MTSVRQALRVAAADRAAGRAGAWAAAVHRGLLALAVLLAALTALGLDVPGLAALRGRWVPTLLVAAALLLAGPLLARVARPLLRPRPERLAARLEDDLGWKDAASTALYLERTAAPGPLPALLVARAAGLVQGLAPGPGAVAGSRRGRALRGALALLFVVALLLPGVLGLGRERGAGRGAEPGPGWREQPDLRTEDADRWLTRNGHLTLLHRDLGAGSGAAGLVGVFATQRPLPVPYQGALALLWDDVERAPLGPVQASSGARARVEQDVRLDQLPSLTPYLTPGKHRARLRLAPSAGPFTVALLSEELEVEIPPGAGGGGSPPPSPSPSPAPEPSPPPPAPAPAPPAPASDPPKPPPSRREEAVTPLVNEGASVRKEQAVVAVRAPDAGLVPPAVVPLAEALRHLERVLEQAVGSERVLPRDRPFLERYFRTLGALVGPSGPAPR